MARDNEDRVRAASAAARRRAGEGGRLPSRKLTMTPTTPRRSPLLRRSLCIAVPAVAGLALAVPQVLAQGNSQKPTTPAVTIDAKANPIVFGTTTTLSGRVSGADADGRDDPLRGGRHAAVRRQLQAEPADRQDREQRDVPVTAKPKVNTQYRAIAQASPTVTSPARLVMVRTLVGLRVSDRTPQRGSFVTFSGSVFPAHDGSRALIQRRTSTGGWIDPRAPGPQRRRHPEVDVLQAPARPQRRRLPRQGRRRRRSRQRLQPPAHARRPRLNDSGVARPRVSAVPPRAPRPASAACHERAARPAA